MNLVAIPLAETPSVDGRLLQAGARTLCLVLLSATGLLLADSARAQERSVEWTHLSSESGDLPAPNGGDQQTATAVLDVDVDGTNDFMIAERTGTPSVVWYRRSQEGWEKYAVENEQLPIEAGSATHDIDGDGDQDVVFGGDAQNNKVWWWENPAPDFAPDQSWTRHLITETPGNKHHDQIFGDVDGDGQAELLFWNQGAQRLYLAEIPDDPQAAGRWETEVIYTYSADSQMEQRGSYPGWRDTNEHEGLYTADVDGDDTLDVVGGGRWVTHRGEGSSTEKGSSAESGIEGRFQEHIVDASYPFSRSAAGQLVEGGRPEVALVVGDGRGPLVLYEYQPDGDEDSGSVGAGTWAATTLIEEVQNGHSLDVVDFNGDGHQDLFVAEMRLGENPDAKTWLLLGDGQGNFTRQVVSEGYGLHQAKIADLDGDEDLDILGKPYTWEAPRIDIWINEGPEQSGSTQSETTGSARGPRPGEGHPSRWYGQADYRLPVQVRAAGYERQDKPVEVTLDAEASPEQQAAARDSTAPVIDVWYGDRQVVGAAGTTQRWVNVLGTVRDPESGVASLTYTLNGAPGRTVDGVPGKLNVGPYPSRQADIDYPGPRRLYRKGDFNADLPVRRLREGPNVVRLTATNEAGRERTKTVRVEYQPESEGGGALPFRIDWGTVEDLQRVAHVLDGRWRVAERGVRTARVGYDRALAIGDTSWTDYQATLPVTIHGIDSAERAPASGGGRGGAFSVTLRWTGHVPRPRAGCRQPLCGWTRLGGGFWGILGPQRENYFRLSAGQSLSKGKKLRSFAPEVGKTYWLKVRAETLSGGGSRYRARVWEKGHPEPDDWTLEKRTGTGNLDHGSLLLIAHHLDLTFGDLMVRPL